MDIAIPVVSEIEGNTSADGAALDLNPNAETEAAPPSERAKDKPAKPGTCIQLVEVKPWPEPVDGAKLLDDLVGAFSRHLALREGAAHRQAI